jgi:hypothetical protein
VAAVRAVLKIDSQFQTLGRFSFFRHSHSQHPAVISSTFLLLRLFALLCGHNPARYQQPATRHFFNRHKKAQNSQKSES